VVIAGSIFLWKSVDDVKVQATAAINATKDTTTLQINAIGKTAQNTVQSEVKKAVSTPSIQRTIDTTVNSQVDAAVQKNPQARIDGLRALVERIGEISTHAAQLYAEDSPEGLYALLNDTEDPNSEVRAYARYLFR
jgi:hypothetical protein